MLGACYIPIFGPVISLACIYAGVVSVGLEIIAVVVLAALGYGAIQYIDRFRKLPSFGEREIIVEYAQNYDKEAQEKYEKELLRKIRYGYL